VQHLAYQLGVEVTVCHYPPGTSKWNKIEHRLFSYISVNWKGQPLVSYETVINLIGATRTKGGLRVKAALDAGAYELGVKIPDAEMARLNLRPHRTRPPAAHSITGMMNWKKPKWKARRKADRGVATLPAAAAATETANASTDRARAMKSSSSGATCGGRSQ
jgi:hypothetical protein